MGVVNPGKIECSLLKQIRSLPDHLKSDPFFSVFRDRSDTARAADSHPLMPSPVTQNAEGSDSVPVKSAEYRRILRKILNPVLINLSEKDRERGSFRGVSLRRSITSSVKIWSAGFSLIPVAWKNPGYRLSNSC